MRIVPFVTLAFLSIAAAPVAAQTPNARAQTLAAEFSKFKDVTKNKRGVSVRKYSEVVSEPWVGTVRDYHGTYASPDQGAYLNLAIDANGRVSGEGRDHDRFTVRDVVIRDAVLIGTRVYQNGKTAPFEAVFMKRSTRSSPNAAFTTRHGVGFLVEQAGTGELRVFAAKESPRAPD